jgi:hypothetical protein
LGANEETFSLDFCRTFGLPQIGFLSCAQRDTDKREIDFVVPKDKKPLFAVECKLGAC